MRNIELKAKLRDRVNAENVCRGLCAEGQGDIHQVDTYFDVREGRFKLRESAPGDDYLVFYRRPDTPEAKGCDYDIAVVERDIKPVLAAALGTLAVVDKVRALYLWENVRIHLDRVEGLGDFIEFEAVLGEAYDDDDGQRKLACLQEAFGIKAEDCCATSYLEMVLDA